MRKKVTITAIALLGVVALSGCDNKSLTRDRAQRILNENRGAACQASLAFRDGGLKKAEADGAINRLAETLSGAIYHTNYVVAEVPGEQDRWLVISSFREQRLQREKNPLQCISGNAQVTAIVDGPMESLNCAALLKPPAKNL